MIKGGVAILDFGSQYTQLIARRSGNSGSTAKCCRVTAAGPRLKGFHPAGLYWREALQRL